MQRKEALVDMLNMVCQELAENAAMHRRAVSLRLTTDGEGYWV